MATATGEVRIRELLLDCRENGFLYLLGRLRRTQVDCYRLGSQIGLYCLLLSIHFSFQVGQLGSSAGSSDLTLKIDQLLVLDLCNFDDLVLGHDVFDATSVLLWQSIVPVEEGLAVRRHFHSLLHQTGRAHWPVGRVLVYLLPETLCLQLEQEVVDPGRGLNLLQLCFHEVQVQHVVLVELRPGVHGIHQVPRVETNLSADDD